MLDVTLFHIRLELGFKLMEGIFTAFSFMLGTVRSDEFILIGISLLGCAHFYLSVW
jgi:hypothetical protein